MPNRQGNTGGMLMSGIAGEIKGNVFRNLENGANWLKIVDLAILE